MDIARSPLGALALALALAAASCGGESSAPTPAAPPSPETNAKPAAVDELKKPTPRAPSRQGGAIVRSPVEDALYVADEDHAMLRRIPIPFSSEEPTTDVELPGPPGAVLALAGKILVTIRDPGLLLVLERDSAGQIREVARVALPDDAWGLAVTDDETTAIISSAWTHKISAVSLARAQILFSIDVPREPRGIATLPGGQTAYVSHLVGADITRIDGLKSASPSVRSVALPAAPLRARVADRPSASLGYATVLSPDGAHLFTARHALGALGPEAWFGAATVDVLSTGSDKPVAPSRAAPGFTISMENGFSSFSAPQVDSAGALPTTNITPFTQPRAMVYRSTTDTLLVAAEGDDSLVELDALAVAPALTTLQTYGLGAAYGSSISVPALCGAPSGIALSEDEATAYVLCRSTYDIAAVALSAHDGSPPPSESHRPVLRFAVDTLPPDAALGRRIFYNATDSTTSGGLGCAGCHPDGRDDGFVWHELAEPPESKSPIFVGTPFTVNAEKGGPGGLARQTPMLAGRVNAAGPYGWHGESETLEDRLVGGFKLHRWSSWGFDEKALKLRAKHLAAFLRRGLVPPPRRDRELTPEEARGKALFLADSTQCSACHVATTEYTDRAATPLRQLPPPRGYDEDPNPAFKVPSLLYVVGTPPYFHDGRAGSLEDVVNLNNDRMGKTNHLTREDRAALIAFLKTL
jgi:cytochrome c peroxidase